MELRLLSKKEALEFIESIPEDGLMILAYDENAGTSTDGSKVDLERCRSVINKSKSISFDEDVISQLGCYKDKIKEIKDLSLFNPTETILAMKL